MLVLKPNRWATAAQPSRGRCRQCQRQLLPRFHTWWRLAGYTCDVSQQMLLSQSPPCQFRCCCMFNMQHAGSAPSSVHGQCVLSFVVLLKSGCSTPAMLSGTRPQRPALFVAFTAYRLRMLPQDDGIEPVSSLVSTCLHAPAPSGMAARDAVTPPTAWSSASVLTVSTRHAF